MNMSLEAHVKEEDAKNRRNLKLFLDRAIDNLKAEIRELEDYISTIAI